MKVDVYEAHLQFTYSCVTIKYGMPDVSIIWLQCLRFYQIAKNANVITSRTLSTYAVTLIIF